MDKILSLLSWIGQTNFFRVVMGVTALWGILGLTCIVFGAVALIPAGRRKEIRPYLFALLPGAQIWYTIRLTGNTHSARKAEYLLWWTPALALTGITITVWAVYFYSCQLWGAVLALAPVAFLMLVLVTVFYIFVRVLEFQGLDRLLKRWQIALSVVGTVFFIPVQRVMLFLERRTLR